MMVKYCKHATKLLIKLHAEERIMNMFSSQAFYPLKNENFYVVKNRV